MKEKKKIIILSHAMELGGAERALLGLLDSIDYKKYRVDLFLLRHEGELLPYINKNVRLLPEIPEYTVLARPMVKTLKEGHIFLTLVRFVAKTIASYSARKYKNAENMISLEYSHKFISAFMPHIQPKEEYDLAISFLTPHYFAAQKVRAKKKIAWIHTDYSKVKVNIASETVMWSAYDAIASISHSVTDGFCKVFPSLRNKIVLIENALPEKLIRDQAEAFNPNKEMSGEIKLLSIGRYCTAKNFDNVPDICAQIVKQGLDIKWYIIGFGGGEALIRQKISEAKMEEHVILLGKKENPYSYIAACNLYVQPSRYEGKSVTVREAQMLGKPVVITKYATSANQLEDNADGIIVPMDNEGCAQGIANLLKDTEKMNILSENCKARDYSNRDEVQKLYKLMED